MLFIKVQMSHAKWDLVEKQLGRWSNHTHLKSKRKINTNFRTAITEGGGQDRRRGAQMPSPGQVVRCFLNQH